MTDFLFSGMLESSGSVTFGNIAVTGSNAPTNGLFLPSTNAVGFSTNSSERMRITAGGNLLVNTTTTPSDGNAVVVIQGIGTNGGGIQLSGGSAGGTMQEGVNGGGTYWSTYTGAVGSEVITERMRMTGNGNILIGTGTTSSNGNATVVIQGVGTNGGGIQLVGGSSGGFKQDGLNGGGWALHSYTGAVGAETYTERMRINLNGNVIIGNGEASATPANAVLEATDGLGTNIAGASLTIQGGRGTGTGAGGSIIFQTAAAGTAGSTANPQLERLRINSAGDVGIGTSSPFNILSSTSLSISGASGGAVILAAGATQYGRITGNSTSTDLATIPAIPLTFSPNLTERMRIASTGNVGVGTASPITTLDVNGNYSFNVVAVPAASIVCSQGVYFTKTITGLTSFTFDNVPQGRVYGFVLELTNGGSATVSWPAAVKWPSATAPTLTAAGVDVLTFITDDGGTTWRGVASMINSS